MRSFVPDRIVLFALRDCEKHIERNMKVMNEQDTRADEMSEKEQLKYTEYSCVRYRINVQKSFFLKNDNKNVDKTKNNG